MPRCKTALSHGLLALLVLSGPWGCGSPTPPKRDAGPPARDAGAVDGGGDSGIADGGLESVALVNDCTLAPLPAPSSFNFALDVEYAQVNGESLKLDVAWPKTPGPHPLIVAVHGGGWRVGERTGYRPLIGWLASQGFAAATVSYRLVNPDAGTNTFPAAVQDVRCSVRWLRAHAPQYAIDPARVAALGGSAGGHLASMVGVATDVSGLDGACSASAQPATVVAAISMAGGQDLRSSAGVGPLSAPVVADFLGCVPESCPMKAALASPRVHVDASDPPFLLIHGLADAMVPISQSRDMRATLHTAGVRATLVEVPNFGHVALEPWNATADTRPASCTLMAFLRQTLQR